MISLTASASAMLCSFPPVQLVQLQDGRSIYGIDTIVAFLQCTSEADNPVLAAFLPEMQGGTAPCPCRRGSTDPACEPTSDGKISRPRRTVPKHDSAGLHGAPHPCCGDGRPWTPRCASARHACGRSLPYQATVTADVSCCRQGHHERVKSAAAKAPARENAALH